jgi:hypothetical protein
MVGLTSKSRAFRPLSRPSHVTSASESAWERGTNLIKARKLELLLNPRL